MVKEKQKVIRPRNKDEATQMAHEEGWRIPKNRNDLRWPEIVDDDNFWNYLTKAILKQK